MLMPSPAGTRLSDRSRPVGAPGVTLLELMIVIVMIGILCAIALTRLDWKRYQADSAGRGVMAELATAQRLALSLQSNMVITLPDTSRMQVLEDKNNDGSGHLRRARPDRSDRQLLLLWHGGAPDDPRPDDGTPITSITFHRDGSADKSGTFYLHGPGDDPTCKHCRAVAIARATGRVVWFTYASGSWKRAN